jgi:hypothetical protein
MEAAAMYQYRRRLTQYNANFYHVIPCFFCICCPKTQPVFEVWYVLLTTVK